MLKKAAQQWVAFFFSHSHVFFHTQTQTPTQTLPKMNRFTERILFFK
jgi:hypothetical protein